MSFRVVFQTEKRVSARSMRTFMRKFQTQSVHILDSEIFERARDDEPAAGPWQYLVAVTLDDKVSAAEEHELCGRLIDTGRIRGLAPVGITGLPPVPETWPREFKIYLMTEQNGLSEAMEDVVRQACGEGRQFLATASLNTFPFSDDEGCCYEIRLGLSGRVDEETGRRLIWAFYFRILGLARKAGFRPVPHETVQKWFAELKS
ncbi:MAG: hypothetical protein HDQ91_04325 [Desulfovibrio sp.]|nr:hypothetical protein [Desulfovibrio sp.]